MVTKALIVADETIHEYISSKYPDWDCQRPVTSVDDLWTGLESQVLQDPNILIFSDQYITDAARAGRGSESDMELEMAIASFAPGRLVMVIAYDPSSIDYLNAAIPNVRAALGAEDGSLYFINPESPEETIDANIAAYAHEYGTNYASHITQESGIPAPVVSTVNAPVVNEPVNNYNRNGMVVTSTSSKGGSGKSSTAILLAAQLAHSSKKSVAEGKASRPLDVCIVDMDTRDGQVGYLIGQMRPTALNIRVHPEWSHDVIKQNLVFDERLGVHALLAPKRPRTSDDVPPEFYAEIIAKLRQMFDVVILDTSVNYLDPLLADLCYPIADVILFVTDLGISSVFGMTRWFQETVESRENNGIGIDPAKIGVVVNKSMSDINMDRGKVGKASMGAPILSAIPSRPQEFLQAANNNRLDLLLNEPSIGNSIYRLARAIMGQKYPLSKLVDEDNSGIQQKNPTGPSPKKPALMPLSQAKPAVPSAPIAVPVTKKTRKGFFGR